jgi:hypothetical protein
VAVGSSNPNWTPPPTPWAFSSCSLSSLITVISYPCGCGFLRLLPKLSKKIIKKMITTYAHHIDLFKHPKERFASYLAMSTTKILKIIIIMIFLAYYKRIHLLFCNLSAAK